VDFFADMTQWCAKIVPRWIGGLPYALLKANKQCNFQPTKAYLNFFLLFLPPARLSFPTVDVPTIFENVGFFNVLSSRFCKMFQHFSEMFDFINVFCSTFC
jgi:hypothetical protein